MNTNEFIPEREHCIHQDEACPNVSHYQGVCDGYEPKDGMYLVKDGTTYKITPRIALPLAKKIDITTGAVTYPTNADRIRSMTDEELAEFFQITASEFSCPPSSTTESCQNAGGWFNGCPKCWLDWLRQEASKKE